MACGCVWVVGRRLDQERARQSDAHLGNQRTAAAPSRARVPTILMFFPSPLTAHPLLRDAKQGAKICSHYDADGKVSVRVA